MSDHPELSATRDGTMVTVHVQPGATRPGVAGRHGDALRVRVSAPPTEGRANDEVVRLLATTFGVPRGSVRLASGASSRRKRLELVGLAMDDAAAVIDKLLGASGST
ncbi:MAG TPA: DUF167 domain-containing protein [Acidimicrobiales bacterium]